ncbi:class I SAM-dependent methyltransferase [Streptosporangium sp. NPDC051022]|uniref:class I SAM-dependent methyltransferase n=1 Tax=Streptosporangium sp. NPDC051022 TaxID=3155752 RepID=UPI00343C2F39
MNGIACVSVRTAFGSYLRAADGGGTHTAVHIHLTACPTCRGAWNRYRWDQASASPLVRELRDFLGEEFTPYLDSAAALAETWRQADPRSVEDVAAFFRASTAYLYNLTIWQASGNRPDYTSAAIPALLDHRVRTVLDYGCGIGNDTLPLLETGFGVTCCDYDSPSTRFLRWRLRRHGHDATVVEPGEVPAELAIDALWIVDTLDHLADLDTALGTLLRRVRVVVCENLTVRRGVSGKGFHHHRPAEQIAAAFTRYGFRSLNQAAEDGAVMIWGRAPTVAAPPGPRRSAPAPPWPAAANPPRCRQPPSTGPR